MNGVAECIITGKSAVTNANLSPNGMYLAVEKHDEEKKTFRVQLWNVFSGKFVGTIVSVDEAVRSRGFCWSPDSTEILIHFSKCVGIWRVDAGKYRTCFSDTDLGFLPRACDWSPDGKLIAIGGDDVQLHLYASVVMVIDACNGDPLWFWDTGPEPMIKCKWCPKSINVAVCTNDYTLQVWGLHGRKYLEMFPGVMCVSSISWSHDCQRIAVSSLYSTFISDLGARSGLIENLFRRSMSTWSPKANELAYVEDNAVKIINFATNSVCVVGCTHQVSSLAWSSCGRQIVIGTELGRVLVVPLCKWTDRQNWQFPLTIRQRVLDLMCIYSKLQPGCAEYIWIGICQAIVDSQMPIMRF